jgi:hypothetical protein
MHHKKRHLGENERPHPPSIAEEEASNDNSFKSILNGKGMEGRRWK